jgi:asparagine synthase (glutamine-hydrolysing)
MRRSSRPATACASAAASRSARRSATGTSSSRWTPSSTSRRPPRSCAERLRESVAAQGRGAAGRFLSGGGLQRRGGGDAWLAGESGGEAVNTCSIAFDDPKFNESEFAQMVADRYRTNHRVETVSSDDFDLIDRWPRCTTSPSPTARPFPPTVCQLARKHVTVALSGDGGDESLGGYRRYRMHMMEEKMRSALPLALRRRVFGCWRGSIPRPTGRPRVPRQDHLPGDGAQLGGGLLPHHVLLRDPLRQQLFSASFKRELQG